MAPGKPCDNCGRRRRLAVYTITAGPETAVVALCGECSAPLVALMQAGHTAPVEAVKGARPRPVRHAVVPVD